MKMTGMPARLMRSGAEERTDSALTTSLANE